MKTGTLKRMKGQYRGMRRARISWMNASDKQILLRLYNDPGEEWVASPRIIAANVDFSHSTVREHVADLRDRGMLTYFDEEGGIYMLTPKARAWLRGEADESDLEEWE